MKNAKIAITSLLSLAIAGQANAQFTYDGSDTLGPIVENLLATGSCGSINYLENGSGAGERAMIAGTQQTAPMSSNLSDQACTDNGGAQQAAVAVDKLLVVRNNGGSDASCDTDFVADVDGYSSEDAPAWAEALQLIYGGANGAGGDACGDAARMNLIDNWSSIWANGCDSGSCTKLRFAFRRGDLSGTTKVFKKLTGISEFCNGAQHEDNDSARTDCADGFSGGGVEYCPNGSLGVVQAIDIPEAAAAVTDGVVTRMSCAPGNFEFGFAPIDGICRDGAEAFSGFLCSYPRDCNDEFGCVNSGLNGSPLNPFMDGRDFNYLHADSSLNEIALPTDGDVQYSYVSMFLNGKCTGGETGSNATLQIGCLVDAVDCSIGFGGRSMLDAPTTSNEFGDACGTTQDLDNVATRSNGLGENDAGYPLSRNLYLNTLSLPVADGKFDCSAVTDADERALCECFFDQSTLNDAVTQAGFVPLANGPEIVACGG